METRMKKTLAFGCFALAFGCDPSPPIRTSTAQYIKTIEYQESFARSDNTTSVTFRGERLKKAVELMDKHEVFRLYGTHEAKGVLDSGTLTIVVRDDDKRDFVITVKNCAQTKVCAFMKEANDIGLVERLPLVCKQSGCTSSVSSK